MESHMNPQENPQALNPQALNPQELAARYVAVWNESSPSVRRQRIAELWAPDGVHYVRTREARGYEALEKRVAESHEKNVRRTPNRFRAVRNAQALRDTVTFNWEMIAPDGEKVLAVGLEFLVVDDQGRIVADYQYVVA
jgi:hypothetical protein